MRGLMEPGRVGGSPLGVVVVLVVAMVAVVSSSGSSSSSQGTWSGIRVVMR